MRRIKLIIQFLGTNFAGWQSQPGQRTVQGELQNAILLTTGEKVVPESSGRTDAGVHAIAMPVHFDTNSPIKSENMYRALNAHLPEDIIALSSVEVELDWHARFSVTAKTYCYYFYASEQVQPYLSPTFAHICLPFDVKKANSVLKHFIGTHDWAGFCSSNTKVNSTIRTIFETNLQELGEDRYCLTVKGDGFLYNMVRIIAGTIIEVGQGKINPNSIPQIIASKKRDDAGRTAQAQGLVLKEVFY